MTPADAAILTAAAEPSDPQPADGFRLALAALHGKLDRQADDLGRLVREGRCTAGAAADMAAKIAHARALVTQRLAGLSYTIH